MAKRNHRLLSGLLAAMLLSSSVVTANATTVGVDESGAGTLAKYYSTNATGVGKEKTITIDGDASDWDESMKIAQGAAWDVANHWRGGHENCVLDTYALFAAWDDTNLYIGWQMVNTTDTWAREGDGPLSDGGRVLDVPLIIALSTNPNAQAMTGRAADGKGIWGVDIEMQTHVDTMLYMSGKPGLGTPGFFRAADSTGAVDYLNTNSCKTFKETGVEYKLAETNINSQIWGLDGSETPNDVCDDSAEWVDYATTSHNTKYDSFYEAKIPLASLGLTKNDLTTNGIGAMVIASRGESGLDCVPFDLTMLDNATESYGSDPSTSHEKDDKDIITASLASIGNGTITPRPVISDTDKKTDTDKTTDTTTDSDTDTELSVGWQVLPLSTQAKAGDTITVKLGLGSGTDLQGVSASVQYEKDRVKLVSAKTVYDGAQVNQVADNEVKWNALLGGGKNGVTFTKETPMVELTFQALTDIVDYFGMTCINDVYDYNFKSVECGQHIDISTSTVTSSDTDSSTTNDKKLEIKAKANAGDTVNVTFSGDLSSFEGISSNFEYDSSALKYVGCSKLDSVQVEENQATGIVRWNCVNINGGSKADIVTFKFEALKSVNGVVGTNTLKDAYDANGKDLTGSVITAKATTDSNDTDTLVDTDKDSQKVAVAAKKGDIVNVSFKAKGLANAAGIQEVVDYNPAALSYNNDAASSVGVIDADATKGRVAWNILFDITGGKGLDLSKETEVAVMSFTALKDIKSVDEVLSYVVKDFYDLDYNTFEFTTTAVSNAVAKPVTRGEGKVELTAKEGNTVKVYCKGADAAKALGIIEELTYDKSALEYVGYGSEMGHFQMDASKAGTIRWSAMFDSKGVDLTLDDNIVVFTFKALKDISSSDNVLSYTVDEFYDYQTKDFDVSNTTMVKASAIAVEKTEDIDPPTNTDAESYSDVDIVDVKGSDTAPTTSDKDTDKGGKTTDSDKTPIVINTDTDKNTDADNTKVTIIFGDVDDDEDITSQDAVKVLRYSVSLEELNDKQLVAADVNDDEDVNSNDSLTVLRFSVDITDPGSRLTGKPVEISIKFNS